MIELFQKQDNQLWSLNEKKLLNLLLEKAEWLANYTPPYTKDEWIDDFQATKITDSVSWYKKSEWEKKYNKYIRTYSNELQNHFNSLPLYNQRRYQWIQNGYIKPYKSEWNNLSASTTTYDCLKNYSWRRKSIKRCL